MLPFNAVNKRMLEFINAEINKLKRLPSFALERKNNLEKLEEFRQSLEVRHFGGFKTCPYCKATGDDVILILAKLISHPQLNAYEIDVSKNIRISKCTKCNYTALQTEL